VVMTVASSSPMGITGFSADGSTLTHNSTGVSYSWTVTAASGYTGFTTEASAKADVSLSLSAYMNPSVTLATRERWPNGSSVTLQLRVTAHSVANSTATVVVSFEDGWTSTRQVTVVPASRTDRSAKGTAALGVTGFTTENSTITQASSGNTYHWSVVGASGYVGYSDETNAKNGFSLSSSGAVLNPTLTASSPYNWPAGSSITLRLRVIHSSIPNETGTFEVVFTDGWDMASNEVALSPSSKTMAPNTSSSLGITSFSTPNSIITQTTPGVTYQWTVVSAAGYTHTTQSDALNDVVLSNTTVLNPTLSLTTPSKWPASSYVNLRLTVTYNDVSHDSALFKVTFQ